MAQEMMMVKPEEFNQLVQYYKGEISDSALLNKAGRIAAETHLLLQDKTIPDAIANARVKELRRERQRLTKRLREVPGVASVTGGQPPPDVDDDSSLANGTLDNLLKQIIKNSKKTWSSGCYAFQVYKTRESGTWPFWYKKRKIDRIQCYIGRTKRIGR